MTEAEFQTLVDRLLAGGLPEPDRDRRSRQALDHLVATGRPKRTMTSDGPAYRVREV
jgi:hypothetical protein